MFIFNESRRAITVSMQTFLPRHTTFVRNIGIMRDFLFKQKVAAGDFKIFNSKVDSHKYKELTNQVTSDFKADSQKEFLEQKLAFVCAKETHKAVATGILTFDGNRGEIFKWVVALLCGCDTTHLATGNREYEAARHIIDAVGRGAVIEGDRAQKPGDKPKPKSKPEDEISPQDILKSSLSSDEETEEAQPKPAGVLGNILENSEDPSKEPGFDGTEEFGQKKDEGSSNENESVEEEKVVEETQAPEKEAGKEDTSEEETGPAEEGTEEGGTEEDDDTSTGATEDNEPESSGDGTDNSGDGEGEGEAVEEGSDDGSGESEGEGDAGEGNTADEGSEDSSEELTLEVCMEEIEGLKKDDLKAYVAENLPDVNITSRDSIDKIKAKIVKFFEEE